LRALGEGMGKAEPVAASGHVIGVRKVSLTIEPRGLFV